MGLSYHAQRYALSRWGKTDALQMRQRTSILAVWITSLREGRVISVMDFKGPVQGDVLLLNSEGKAARRNKAAQWVATRRHAKFTHVAFCIGLTNCIHADLNGVDVIRSTDLFDQYSGPWRAIRHVVVDKIGRVDPTRVIHSAEYFLGMKYAKLKNLIGSDDLEGETFCSLLIKDVYMELGVGLFAETARPYPVHFQELPETDTANWSDVTDEHVLGRDTVEKHPYLKEDARKFGATVRAIRSDTLENEKLRDLMIQFQEGVKPFDDAIGYKPTLDATLSEPPPIKYWDQGKKRKAPRS